MKLWGVVLALCAIPLACHKPPPPTDPGAGLYHEAVVAFASASAQTRDLSYRDPHFDAVLDKLRLVPLESEARAKAEALTRRITEGRALARQQELESLDLRAGAELAPQFRPEPQVIFPAVRGADAGLVSARQPPGGGAPAVGLPSTIIPAGAPFDPLKPRALPEWYRRSAEPSRSSPAMDDTATAAGSSAAPSPEAVSEPSESPSAPPHRAAARPPVAPASEAPPPVFGLPGPSNHALMGGPQ